jgi:Uma2 family endonuclease
MSIAVIPEPTAELSRYRFTVEDYYRMAELGIISADARVELIGGEVVTMSPMNRAHKALLLRIQNELVRGISNGKGLVFVQTPVRLDKYNEPVPDLLIVKPSDDEYRESDIAAKDVLLVIEVSDSTLMADRTRKGRLYARAGIPEFWVVNAREEILEVHTRPAEGVYTRHRLLKAPAGVTPGRLRSFRLELAKVFK